MQKDLLLFQAGKTAKKNHEQTQKAHTSKQIKSLNNTGLLNFKLLALSEKDGKILVDQKEVNNILLNIERTKHGEFHSPDTSKISLNDLKKRMNIINPEFPVQDLGFLFQNKSELTSKELYEQLQLNEINDIDPVNEALKLICDDRDQIDYAKVSQLMHNLGYGKLDQQDTQILNEMLDVNHDARVDKQDLKEIFGYVVNKQKHHP